MVINYFEISIPILQIDPYEDLDIREKPLSASYFLTQPK